MPIDKGSWNPLEKRGLTPPEEKQRAVTIRVGHKPDFMRGQIVEIYAPHKTPPLKKGQLVQAWIGDNETYKASVVEFTPPGPADPKTKCQIKIIKT